MDPLSIATASLSLASGIAKASLTLSQFSREFRDSAEDIDALRKEIQALAAVLNPLTRSLTRPHVCPLPGALVLQVDNTISGCIAVLTQIGEMIQKYRRDNAWTSTKWVIFGKDDVLKLRESLEAYTMALSIGLHAISLNTGQDIKDDTEVIRSHIETLKLNTDEILARVNSIREKGPSPHSRTRVEEWIEQMSVLSTYAESSYNETLIEQAELPLYQKSPSLAPIREGFQVQATEHQDRSSPKTPTSLTVLDLSGPIREVPTSQSSPSYVRLNPRSVQSENLTIEAPTNQSPRLTDGTWPPSPASIASTTPIQGDSTNTTDGDPWSRFCFDQIEDFSEEVRAIALRVCRDEALIKSSQAKRETLDELQRRLVDEGLRDFAHSGTVGDIRKAVANGADVNCLFQLHDVSILLKFAIERPGDETLVELLRCGADPNSKIANVYTIKEPHLRWCPPYWPTDSYLIGKLGNTMCPPQASVTCTALAYAAKLGKESAVWALYAAGAKVNVPHSDIDCPRCNADLLSYTRVCLTPLLAALTTGRTGHFSLRVVRFLLATGADPSASGCDRLERHDGRLPCVPPLQAAFITHRDSGVIPFVQLLIKAGAKKIDRTPERLSRWVDVDAFPVAIEDAAILRLIAPLVDKGMADLWRSEIRTRLRHLKPEVIAVLMEEPYFQEDYLHLLVMEYMEDEEFGGRDFASVTRDLEQFLTEGADPKVSAECYYAKRGLISTRFVLENVTAIKLAQNIRDRKQRECVVKLLKQSQK